VQSSYKQDTERHNDRFRTSTSNVLQEAPQLKTPPVFSSNNQSSTPHSPSAMLQLTCHRHPRRPYCRQQVQRPTFCALLTLQRTSSLALPQDPSPSCSILTFGRPSFASILFLRETTVPSFFARLQRLDLRETFITTFIFSLAFFFIWSLQSSPDIVCYGSAMISVSV